MPAAVSQLNVPPKKDAACYYCKVGILESVRAKPGITVGHVETDFMALYYCVNQNCQKYGLVTALYTFSDAAPEPEIVPL